MRTSAQRILIIGNSGSGKSHLSRALSRHFALPVTDLDDVFWLNRHYMAKRPGDQVWAAIDALREEKCWIVEGVYGAMAERLLDRADLLLWLALSWEDCAHNVLAREAERNPDATPEERKSFEALMEYAAHYEHRTNSVSRVGHRRLYDAFNGVKLQFQSHKQVNAYLEGLQP